MTLHKHDGEREYCNENHGAHVCDPGESTSGDGGLTWYCTACEADIPPCNAVYTTSVLGGQDVCARLFGHTGRHDWRP